MQRGNGERVLVGGDWQHRGPNGDRDGDGILNQDDRDRDRDDDGVRNRNDRFPDDRRRSQAAVGGQEMCHAQLRNAKGERRTLSLQDIPSRRRRSEPETDGDADVPCGP